MSCFEISHSSRCDGLFFEVTQDVHTYYKTKITYPVAVQLGNLARSQLSMLSARQNQGILPTRFQNCNNDSSTLDLVRTNLLQYKYY
eukprot:4355631-Ditylum_brightwellii.AAC.1